MGMCESKEVAAKIRKEYRSKVNGSVNCNSRITDAAGRENQKTIHENKLCKERWKATIRNIVEQVHDETEQWSQVQELLHHVHHEMEDLKKSRDFWEDRALQAAKKIATLEIQTHDWREKARGYEIKISELQSHAALIRNEIKQVRHRRAVEQTIPNRELLPSNSERRTIGLSDMHLESFTYHEASVTVEETSNQCANRERAGHPKDDKNWNGKTNEPKYNQTVKPRICSQKNSIENPSQLCEVQRNQQSWSKHLQQKDCVTEQLSENRSKKMIQNDHSTEKLLLLPKKHGKREITKLNQRKRDQVQGSLASRKWPIVNRKPWF